MPEKRLHTEAEIKARLRELATETRRLHDELRRFLSPKEPAGRVSERNRPRRGKK